MMELELQLSNSLFDSSNLKKAVEKGSKSLKAYAGTGFQRILMVSKNYSSLFFQKELGVLKKMV
jgi:hypothetical protein